MTLGLRIHGSGSREREVSQVAELMRLVPFEGASRNFKRDEMMEATLNVKRMNQRVIFFLSHF